MNPIFISLVLGSLLGTIAYLIMVIRNKNDDIQSLYDIYQSASMLEFSKEDMKDEDRVSFDEWSYLKLCSDISRFELRLKEES